MVDRNFILQYLKSKNLCVISTADSNGKTESAVINYTLKDDFTFLISTKSNTRKIKNILNNNQVSLTIGGLNFDTEIQIDASAYVANSQQSQDIKNFILSKNPQLANYFSDLSKFITIVPNWIRWSDFSKNPPEIMEINPVEDVSTQLV